MNADVVFGSGTRTTELYWDCDCEREYIHPKNVYRCGVCGFTRNEMPDSHIWEVKLWLEGRARYRLGWIAPYDQPRVVMDGYIRQRRIGR